eukprot:184582_1
MSLLDKENRRLTRLLGHLAKNDCKKQISPPTIVYTKHPSTFPLPSKTFWGQTKDNNIDKNIYKFDASNIFSSNNNEVNIMNKYIDLWLESNKNNRFHHAIKQESKHWEMLSKMKGVGYGINFEDFYKLIKYWKHNFNLNNELIKLTSFNHFRTNIQGLNIHFIKESTNSRLNNTKSAILLLHGWPGSIWEFHKMIHPLKSKLKHMNNEFTDIIIPSLPGYAFSEYPTHSSKFNIIAVASIMKDLMEKRLGYKNYIVSAGDWGAHTARCMGWQACLESDKNRKLLGLLLHDSWTSGRDLNSDSTIHLKKYSKAIYRLLAFSGYQHIQCERPNTIGIALESSPVGILAWIYEMYLAGSNGPLNIKQITYNKNGNRIIGGEVNWNDVIFTAMLYWLNGNITTSSNYYADNIKLAYTTMRYYYMPENIKIGLVDWNGSSGFGPYNKYHFRNIIYQYKQKTGGHFSALEKPNEYVNNIIKFISLL